MPPIFELKVFFKVRMFLIARISGEEKSFSPFVLKHSEVNSFLIWKKNGYVTRYNQNELRSFILQKNISLAQNWSWNSSTRSPSPPSQNSSVNNLFSVKKHGKVPRILFTIFFYCTSPLKTSSDQSIVCECFFRLNLLFFTSKVP